MARKNTIPLAIIGGGPAAVSFIASLLQLLGQLPRAQQRRVALDIICFEKAAQIGPGLAFQPDEEVLVVNQRASTMGIYRDHPTGFAEWLKQRAKRLKRLFPSLAHDYDEHPPRVRYGEYAAAEFACLQQKALRQGHRI